MSKVIRSLVLFGVIGVLLIALISFLAYRHFTTLSQSSVKGPAQPSNPAWSPSAMGNLASLVSQQQDQPVKRVSHAMAEPFDQGFLPTPIPAEEENPDDAVAALAKKIAGHDEYSTPALLSALQLAGFTIRAKNGSVLLRPISLDGSQGMAFDAWQVASMAKLYDEHWQLSLDDLGVVLAKILPPLRNNAFTDLFLKGMARSSQGEQPLRAWSRLIIELGRNSSQPYDLLAMDTDPKKVQLDAVQVSLILQRISGDLLAKSKTAPATLKSAAYRAQWKSEPRLEPAVYHPGTASHFLLVTAPPQGVAARPEGSPDSSGPCPLSEITLTILDMNAIIKTTEWTELIGLGEGGAGIKAGPVANAILALLKVLLIYSSLDADLSMDADSLVRTQDTEKGATILFTAHVFFTLNDKWAVLNCLRPFLSREGIDFGNLPNHGAADGVGVSWFLADGGVDLSATSKDLQKFADAQEAAIVMFDNDGGHEGETWNNLTDKKGNATTYISGRPQERDLTHFKLAPVPKKGAVTIEVKLKGADTEKFLGEMIDVMGPALGLASGDVLGGLINGLTELAFRMHWRVGKAFEFPVIDWRMCDEGWMGTITLSRRVHSNHSQPWSGFGPGLRSHQVDVTEKHEYTVISSTGQYEQSGLRAQWTGQYDEKDVDTATSSGSTQACSSASGIDTTTTTLTGSDSGTVDIALYANDTRYQLIFSPGDQAFKKSIGGESVHQRVIRLSGLMRGWEPSACDGKDDTSTDTLAPGSRSWTVVAQPIQGTVDPKQPQRFTGAKEMPDPEDPSGRITIHWDLVFCSGGKH